MDEKLPLKLKRNERFRHRGKDYLVRGAGVRTLKLLRSCQDLSEQPSQERANSWMRLRSPISEAVLFPTPVLLCHVIDESHDPMVTRLAILLLAKIKNPYAVASVLPLVHHDEYRVRRSACRALHRLSAWNALRDIALTHPDARIRAMAQQDQSKPWASRLENYLGTTEAINIPSTAHELVVSPGARFDGGSAPREASEIRRLLLRIRRWARRRRRRTSWWITRYCLVSSAPRRR